MAKSLGLLIVVVLLIPVLLLAACQSYIQIPYNPQVYVTVPVNMIGGESSTWTVTWNSFGTPPYTIIMKMGGGTTQNIPAGTAATSPFSRSFEMIGPSLADDVTYTYTVLVSDACGKWASTSGDYSVGPICVLPPNIDSVSYKAPKLVVDVSDEDGVPLTASVSEPPGLNAEFTFSAAGTYHLGFEQFNTVKRTYFSDMNSNEYYWADISNDYPDVPNSIKVVN
ncbi:hypothetical protein JW859_03180 [bacterium]|nr:hypothetical protein [bacterium]